MSNKTPVVHSDPKILAAPRSLLGPAYPCKCYSTASKLAILWIAFSTSSRPSPASRPAPLSRWPTTL